MYILEN